MKKLLAYALILVMLLTLAACGNKAPETQPTQPQTTAATTEGTEPTAPQTTAAPETVTVYLLEESVLYDSGKTEYYYDTDYNIVAARVYTIEDETMFVRNYEEQDANGMPCVVRTAWPDGDDQIRNLTYFDDGKLKEEQEAGSNFTGFQYEYDKKGDLAEKREYYEGILESITYYEYTGRRLAATFSENAEGSRIASNKVINGRITEKISVDLDSGTKTTSLYEYDENGNLIKTSMVIDAQTVPGDMYSYRAVEVDADRAAYLMAQQRYLISGAY